MNSTRRGTKQRRLAGVAVLLLGLISMMVGFLGAAGSATADETLTAPCDVETITVTDKEAWTEVIEHPAVEEVTEDVMTDPGQPYIAPTEDSWTDLSWYVWTGGPRESAPGLDDEGWNDVPALPNGLPHDPVPGTVYNVSHNVVGLGSWFKYDGTLVPGTPGQEYIAPTYEEVVVTEGKPASKETIEHPAETHTVPNPAWPCPPVVEPEEEEPETDPVVLPEEEIKDPEDPKAPPAPEPASAPTVLGVEAQAPAAAPVAAVPTSVDAGLSPAVASEGTNLWMLAGGLLLALGMALGFVPTPARGRHGR